MNPKILRSLSLLVFVVAAYGSNCPQGDLACGEACYDPNVFTCIQITNVLYLCPVGWEVCDNQCYNPSTSDCVSINYTNPNSVTVGNLIFDLTSLYTNQTLISGPVSYFYASFPDGFECGGDAVAIACQVYNPNRGGPNISTGKSTSLAVQSADSNSITLTYSDGSDYLCWPRSTTYEVVCNASSSTPVWSYDVDAPDDSCSYPFIIESSAGCPQDVDNVGKMICPKGDIACALGCLDPTTYWCVNQQTGMFCLNGYNWCEGVDACYDPSLYSCQNGQLVQN